LSITCASRPSEIGGGCGPRGERCHGFVTASCELFSGLASGGAPPQQSQSVSLVVADCVGALMSVHKSSPNPPQVCIGPRVCRMLVLGKFRFVHHRLVLETFGILHHCIAQAVICPDVFWGCAKVTRFVCPHLGPSVAPEGATGAGRHGEGLPMRHPGLRGRGGRMAGPLEVTYLRGCPPHRGHFQRARHAAPSAPEAGVVWGGPPPRIPAPGTPP
jgi:hypothetical protein